MGKELNMKFVRLLGMTMAFCVAVSTLSAKEGKDGWHLLFNGKNFDGWEQHGGDAVYKVEDGVIVGHSVPNTPNSFMCTKKKFTDFELFFEVKVDDALNSGVQIRSNIKGNDRVYGPQVEIESAPGESGYIYGEGTGRGWLSQDRRKKDTFKNGKWNQYRVLAKGNRIKTWVNGIPVADLEDDKASQKGFVGLQVHGVGGREEPLYVRWRNIRLRELNE